MSIAWYILLLFTKDGILLKHSIFFFFFCIYVMDMDVVYIVYLKYLQFLVVCSHVFGEFK
jgi:hypothetical protein